MNTGRSEVWSIAPDLESGDRRFKSCRPDQPIRTGAFRYARFADIETFHRDGWMMVADLGPTHGLWSVLMWRCDCERGEE